MLDKRDYPGAVDVARYKLLDRFGGIYLDCDWYPARDDLSFDAVLPMIGLMAFDEKHHARPEKAAFSWPIRLLRHLPGILSFASFSTPFQALSGICRVLLPGGPRDH